MDALADGGWRAGGGALCCVIITVIVVIAIVTGFDSLDATQIGLDYNRITSRVDGVTGYSNGRYFLGPGHRFLKYPSSIQSIKFSTDRDSDWTQELASRTSDGLEVKLEVEFNFQLSLRSEAREFLLYNLFEKFGGPESYRSFFALLAIDEITQMATRYNASTIFSQRDRVGDDMKDALNELFRREAFCNVTNVQLKKLTLPEPFENAIRQTQVSAESVRTALAERNAQLVIAQTEVLQAEQEAERITIDAEAAAQTILVNNNAFISQFLFSQKLQAERLAVIYDQLGENETLLFDFLNMRAIRDHNSANSVINLGSHS